MPSFIGRPRFWANNGSSWNWTVIGPEWWVVFGETWRQNMIAYISPSLLLMVGLRSWATNYWSCRTQTNQCMPSFIGGPSSWATNDSSWMLRSVMGPDRRCWEKCEDMLSPYLVIDGWPKILSNKWLIMKETDLSMHAILQRWPKISSHQWLIMKLDCDGAWLVVLGETWRHAFPCLVIDRWPKILSHQWLIMKETD